MKDNEFTEEELKIQKEERREQIMRALTNRHLVPEELVARDLFAVFAMQAILSGNQGTHTNRWELARDAYRVADAMLTMRDEA